MPDDAHAVSRLVDAAAERAIAAGMTVAQEIADEFYGDRTVWLEDPFGCYWDLRTHIEDVSDDELERRMNEARGGE